MQEFNDITLLQEYAEHGSDDAFAVLVERHINKVYSVAFRHTGNQHQADEITQVVFLILARKSRKLGQKVILEGWLYQTARLTALASIRSEMRRTQREQEAYMQSVSTDQESQVWPQIAPLLDAAITTLNKTDRDALTLRYFYGENVKEIAARLRLSEGATRTRLHRTLEKLRQFFGKRGIVSTSEVIAGAISAHAVQAAPQGLARNATALALAKDPAASVSTLTLIKGALKTMAWTKAKSICVAGLVVIFAAGSTPIVIKQIRRHSDAPVLRTTAATGDIKGQFFGPGKLVDAGNATPEAAWESRYWARAQGDYDLVIAGTDPKAIDVAKAWMGEKTGFHSRSQEEFSSFQGFQILARKDLATNKVELKYQFGFQEDRSSQQTKIVTMEQVNCVWRCAQTRIYDASWDAGSAPEPQS